MLTTILLPPLLPFPQEIGLIDTWQLRNLKEECFFFFTFSQMHMSLLRIDLALGNTLILPLIANAVYSARGLSDHCLLVS